MDHGRRCFLAQNQNVSISLKLSLGGENDTSGNFCDQLVHYFGLSLQQERDNSPKTEIADASYTRQRWTRSKKKCLSGAIALSCSRIFEKKMHQVQKFQNDCFVKFLEKARIELFQSIRASVICWCVGRLQNNDTSQHQTKELKIHAKFSYSTVQPRFQK